MRAVRTFLGFIAVACSWTAAIAAEEKRVALVIGNSNYQTVSRLNNPVRDASATANLFKNAGFKVFLRTDLGNVELRRAIRDFQVAARDADMAVIYFAGHGLEIKGINYLVPVDASLASDLDAVDEAIPLDRMLEAVEQVKKLRLVILDACRDNPFEKRMTRNFSTRAVTRGLAEIGPPSNMLVSFAAKAGSTADDGAEDHSPFTAAMLKHLATPGLEIRIAMGKIRDQVVQQTGNRQEPSTYGSLGGEEIYLFRGVSDHSSLKTNDTSIQAAYESALRVNTKEAWNAFILHHPSGFHADLARIQLTKGSGPANVPSEPNRANTQGAAEDHGKSRIQQPAPVRKPRKQDAKQQSASKQVSTTAVTRQRSLAVAEKREQSAKSQPNGSRADAQRSQRRPAGANTSSSRRMVSREAPPPPPAGLSIGIGGMLGLFGILGGR